MNQFDVDHLFEQARSGELVIDCPRMTLRPNWALNQELFGAGEIRLDKDRRLQLKMFCHQNPFNMTLGNAGDLIGHHQYHSLTAIDLKGISWRCEQVYPEYTSIGHQSECVISAVLWQIKGEANSLDCFPSGGTRFASFDEIEVPANRETVTTVESANGKNTSARYDTWQDTVEEIPVAITNLRPGILVACHSIDLAQEDVDSIQESLIFAKATIFQWHFICWDTEEKQHLIINSRLFPQPRSRLRPPYNSQLSRDVQGVFGLLLKRYYSFCRGMPNKQHWHPVTRHIYSACEGSAGSVEQEMLSLSVSVEGVVNALFKAGNDLFGTNPMPIQDHARKAIDALEILGRLGISTSN